MSAQIATKAVSGSSEGLHRNEKAEDTRYRNIVAAQNIADTIRASLGPKGMDKMIKHPDESVIITNDGATILKEISVIHPTARMMVEMSKAQDVEAGDGTTSVVIIAGALLGAAKALLEKGIHPQKIASAFLQASKKGVEILNSASKKIPLDDKDTLVNAVVTALESKVVSQNAEVLAPMAVDAVYKVTDITKDKDVDLRNIRVVKKLGGTIEDTEFVDGLVFTNQKVSRAASGPRKITDAKIGLIQFCLSPPKTDMESSIVIRDYQAMDRILREERLHIASMVKKIAATGCNVLLVQKSILRDAVTDLSLDFLAKANILVVRDIEREDIEFISKTLKCQPIASIDRFKEDWLGSASLVVDEATEAGGRITRISGVPGKQTVTVLLRASNQLILDEAERSFHDALCVVRSIVKNNAVISGGGVAEMLVSLKLREWASQLADTQVNCTQAYAEALEVIPYTLAQNSGMDPLDTVVEIVAQYLKNNTVSGIDVKNKTIYTSPEKNIIQPLLVSTSALQLATETVIGILKIDDIVLCR